MHRLVHIVMRLVVLFKKYKFSDLSQKLLLKITEIIGLLHAQPLDRNLSELVSILSSKEKDFTVFGMIELKRSTLVDVSSK